MYHDFSINFAAFLTRSFDQIRMSQYSFPKTNLKIAGSHCGISIGTDGPSQMALEDLSLFGSILKSVILYPSTGIATQKLTKQMLTNHGITYLRLTRDETAEIYKNEDEFPIGGSKTLLENELDEITLIGAGITIFECLKAVEIIKTKNLKKTKISQKNKKIPKIRVIDLYSVKPFDKKTILKAARETKAIIVVEDHFAFGGIFSNLSAFLASTPQTFNPNWGGIHSLAVTKIPRSGQKEELFSWAKIDAQAIVDKIEEILKD